jgi:LysM repeat protein
MDTISRENNNMLPIAGILVGLVGVVLGGIALAQASKANKGVADHQPKIEKVDAIEAQVGSASASAEKAAKDVRDLTRSTQEAFNAVGGKLGEFQTSITKLEDAMKKPVVAEKAGGKKGSGPAVAGPGEYIVKSGDGGTKIAKTLGVSIGDLQSVNPGVNWNKLAVGQKLKVPSKK